MFVFIVLSVQLDFIWSSRYDLLKFEVGFLRSAVASLQKRGKLKRIKLYLKYILYYLKE